MTYRLGLTGSISTGKSTVLNFFAEIGVPVYSADAAVHELYAGPATAAVEKLFPGVSTDGRVDRQKLGGALVKEPEKLNDLEALVHPMVHEKMYEFLNQAVESNAQMAVLEIPLLFETGTDYPIDGVAVTICDEAIQRERALKRHGMSVEKFNTILARQMPQAEKAKRADFIIHTDVSLDQTRDEVEKIARSCGFQGQAVGRDQ